MTVCELYGPGEISFNSNMTNSLRITSQNQCILAPKAEMHPYRMTKQLCNAMMASTEKTHLHEDGVPYPCSGISVGANEHHRPPTLIYGTFHFRNGCRSHSDPFIFKWIGATIIFLLTSGNRGHLKAHCPIYRSPNMLEKNPSGPHPLSGHERDRETTLPVDDLSVLVSRSQSSREPAGEADSGFCRRPVSGRCESLS